MTDPDDNGADPRVLGLLTVVVMVWLAVILTLTMNKLEAADRCLLAAGVACE